VAFTILKVAEWIFVRKTNLCSEIDKKQQKLT